MPTGPTSPTPRPGTTRRRAPAQDRAVELVRRLLDATAQVLDEVGREGLSTNKVAKRAHVAVGSIYQYFPNKEALLDALVEDRLARLGDLVRARMLALDTHDFASAADAMVRAVVDLLSAEPGLVPILMSRALFAPDIGITGRLRSDADVLARAFLAQLDERTVPDLDIAVFVSTHVAGYFGAILAGPGVDPDLRERAIAEVVRMLSLWMTSPR